MTSPSERTPRIGEQTTQARRPVLADFVTLTPSEKLTIEIIKTRPGQNEEELLPTLEVTKTRKIAGTDNGETTDLVTVSAELLDEARKWVLVQPYKDAPREELERLLEISLALNRMLIALDKYKDLPQKPFF